MCTKVADVLTQLLVSGNNNNNNDDDDNSLFTDDPADVILVKSAMSTILIHDTPSKRIEREEDLGEGELIL